MTTKKDRRKNLNPNSHRNWLIQQRDHIDIQLAVPVQLTRVELLNLFEQYASAIEDEYSDNTIKLYKRYALDFIGNHSSNDTFVTKKDCNEYKERITEMTTSTKTINTKITAVNKFLHFCDLVDFTISEDMSQDENFVQDRIYDHEYKRMLAKSKSIGWMQLHYLIKVMGRTGIRVSEREYITVEAVNSPTLDFNVLNKGKRRTVPLPQDLARELRKYAREQGINSGQIFNMDYQTEIYRPLKKLAGLCKIKKSKIKPHEFRHYFGFKYVESNGNISITALANILGHASVETTRIYTRGTSQDARRTMEKMK